MKYFIQAEGHAGQNSDLLAKLKQTNRMTKRDTKCPERK